MPSLWCLISALTQARGGDLLFRFASSVQSCCGEGGALQADVAVYGEHSPCSGRAASSFGSLSPGAVHLFSLRRAARAARGLCSLSMGAAHLFPSEASGSGSQRLGALSPGAVRLFPPWPQHAPEPHFFIHPLMDTQVVLSVLCHLMKFCRVLFLFWFYTFHIKLFLNILYICHFCKLNILLISILLWPLL